MARYDVAGFKSGTVTDITRSLQQKQDQIVKAQKQHDLLSDLDALPSPEGILPAEGIKTSPMGEPNPTLPLWRRVDRRFWWNEWLLKPFLDAGVNFFCLALCGHSSDPILEAAFIYFAHHARLLPDIRYYDSAGSPHARRRRFGGLCNYIATL